MPFPIRIGLKMPQQIRPIDEQREAWRMADAAGFDHIWPFDHLIALGPDPARPIFDGWTILGAIAENTNRVRIGLNVTGNLYRHPGLLAKIAVTVDHLSNGRLEFGIGAAWNEREFTQQGLPFPSPADRVRMLDESIRATKLLWTEPRASFAGRFYQLTRPSPSQSPCRSGGRRSGSAPRAPSARSACGEARRRLERHRDRRERRRESRPAEDPQRALRGGGPRHEHDPSLGQRARRRFRRRSETSGVEPQLGYSEFLLFPGPDASLRAGVEKAAKLRPRLRQVG